MAGSVNNLGQKFELHGYTVFFDIKDSLAAESILDSLDRATPILKQVFNLSDEPKGVFYLVNDGSEVESILGTPAKPNESVRLDLLTDTVCIILSRIDAANCGEIAVKELAYFYQSSGDLTVEFFSNHDMEEGSRAHDYLQGKYKAYLLFPAFPAFFRHVQDCHLK